MKNVAVFVGSRADLGPLEPVIQALEASSDVSLTVLCGVSWSAESLMERLASSTSGPTTHVHQLAGTLPSVSEEALLAYGEALSRGLREFLSEEQLDVIVVLGDRWELLYLVPHAFLARIPIVHLHGGEVTEGALDERVRHAVTKLADVHCVASPDAAVRMRRMGEGASRIVVTGAPGLDRLVGVPSYDDSQLSSVLGAPVSRPLALFTYHPVTATAAADLGDRATACLRAALDLCGTVIVTAPGMDAGRDDILEATSTIAERDDRVILVDSLGPVFPGVLASVDVVIGNSSSGIIEAAAFGVPVVDVGARQAGRLRGGNVIHADETRSGVAHAISLALSAEFRATSRLVENPYGDGSASAKIVEAILAAPAEPVAKSFVDPPGSA